MTVNGERAKLGLRADPSLDVILIDNEPMRNADPIVYVVLHKPAGVLSSLSSQGGWPTVVDLVDVGPRVYPVGRLDLESEGLILLTNDGQLTHALTHPSHEHEKEYRVLLDPIPTKDQLHSWREGVRIDGLGETGPAKVWLEHPSSAWVGVILTRGMKRQIRETALTLGLKVQRLIRTRISNLKLGDLESGAWRYLTDEETEGLQRAASEAVEVR